MSSNPKNAIEIKDTVAPGFESVKSLYERNMNSLQERHNSLWPLRVRSPRVMLETRLVGSDYHVHGSYSPTSGNTSPLRRRLAGPCLHKARMGAGYRTPME